MLTAPKLSLRPLPSRAWLVRSALATSCLFGLPIVTLAQAGVAGLQSLGNAVPTHTVRGQVINAVTGLPVARALVHLNGRAVLSDAQGKFQMADVMGAQVFAQATRPGFSDASNGAMASAAVTDLDVPLEIKMYPNAVITGAVTGSDGLPLTQISVQLRRSFPLPSGIRWVPGGYASTDSHGEYRFSQPAGRYQIAVEYMEKSRDTGEAVLPVVFPARSGTSTSTYIELAAGEERRIDLRPRTGPVHPVALTLDGVDNPRGLQITAITALGESCRVRAVANGDDWVVSLPTGTYTLRARSFNRDTPGEGSARITVAGRGNDATTIHISPPMIIPIELSVDPHAVVSATPSNRTQIAQRKQNQGPSIPAVQLVVSSRGPAGAFRPGCESGDECE